MNPAKSMRAWVGLGANLGDAGAMLGRALHRIDAHPAIDVLRSSSIWRSAPIDAEGPDYRNAVAEIDTSLEPQALLDALLAIENTLGRERAHRNAPRTIDLDLLIAVRAGAELSVDTPTLKLPHPRLHRRAFALAPLAELDASLRVAGHGTVAALLAACKGQRIEREGPMSGTVEPRIET